MANILIIIFLHTAASLTGPVLIIDTCAVLVPYASPNPFNKVSSSDFKEIIADISKLSDSILIFVEENLSIEDLSRKDAKGSSYQYMRKKMLEKKVQYIPSVIDPLKSLHEVLPPLDTHIAKICESIRFCDKKAKYHYVHFEEPEGDTASRAEILRRHDLLINKTYHKFACRRPKPIVIVYTGRNNPMISLGVTGGCQKEAFSGGCQKEEERLKEREKERKEREERETEEREREKSKVHNVMKFSGHALIRLSGVTLQQGSLLTELIPMAGQALRFARSRIDARVALGHNLELVYNFGMGGHTWSADSVVLLEGGEEVGRTFMGIGAPLDCSYFCAEPMEIINTRDSSIVRISQYQLQPLLHGKTLREKRLDGDTGNWRAAWFRADNTTTKATATAAPTTSTVDFDDDKTVTCGVHFTSQILAGTFVAGIVLSIAMTGIVMLSDCRSNQRMDDANQPPLVIAQLL